MNEDKKTRIEELEEIAEFLNSLDDDIVMAGEQCYRDYKHKYYNNTSIMKKDLEQIATICISHDLTIAADDCISLIYKIHQTD